MSGAGDIRRGLLAPQSLAIVGASDDPGKTTGRPLAYLRRSGWAGRIYPVNPRRETVQGERAWPSVGELPETPDHALILTGTEGVREAVEACARAGVKAASVLAGGFAEAGEAGRSAQEELTAIARAGGMRLLGPSSLGFADPRKGLILTANAAFADPEMPAGRVFAASHSGSMIGALASRGAAKGLGFAGLVSVGVEADLTLGEICLAALDDPEIDSFLLFLESLRHAGDLRRFAIAADKAGKPVVAYKLGRSPQAAEMAQSHTGAMAGEDVVADAFFQACGIVRVETLDGLLEAPTFARRMLRTGRKARTPAVGVVATTGGGAAMVVDQLGVRGVEVRAPEAATWDRMAAAGVVAERGRVVDLTLAGTQYKVMRAALEAMTSAPEFDVVVAVAGSSARFHPELAVQPAADVAPDAVTPLAMFATPEATEALRRLAEAGVAAFRTPESCADVVAATLKRRAPKAWDGSDGRPGGPGAFIDEAQAYARVAVSVAPFEVVEIGAAPKGLNYPVVVKGLSAELPHKTDAGAVILHVADAAGVRAAAAQIAANVARAKPEVQLTHVLVQEMTRGIGEVLVGFRRDAEAGPVVMLAPGGILAELSGERALRIAPVDEPEAWEMIESLPSLRALAGYRGRPKGDLDALAKAVVAMSTLAADAAVVEAEINPLMVRPEGGGVVAVDALVRVEEGR
ncbi:MAG: acetate--CoA ligase family protein [Phenylobacterium sp.]